MTIPEAGGHNSRTPFRSLPAALREPVGRVRPGWVAAVALTNLGINAAFFGPLQVLLAQQSQAFDPAHKEAVLALATGFGAAVSLVANPVAGALSDRTTSRFGRRVPWVLGGTVLAFAALLLLAGAPGVAVMVLGWCLVQAGCNAAYAAVTAAVPDQVPAAQRGQIGGIAAMGQTVGIVLGAYWPTAGGFAGYLYCPPSSCSHVRCRSCSGGAVLRWTGRTGRRSAPSRVPEGLLRVAAALPGLRLGLGADPLPGESGQQPLHTVPVLLPAGRGWVRAPAMGVLVLTGIYAAMVVVTAVLGGPWSDRVGRRKPFVVASAVTIATASVIVATVPTWPAALVAAAVLGAGFGMFLAVDFALLTQVLPNALDRGKDLGVINVAEFAAAGAGAAAGRSDCAVPGRLPRAVRRGRRRRPVGRRVRAPDQGRTVRPRAAGARTAVACP